LFSQPALQIDGSLYVHAMDTIVTSNNLLVQTDDGTLAVTTNPQLEVLDPPQPLPLTATFMTHGEHPGTFYQNGSRVYLMGKIFKPGGAIAKDEVISILPPVNRPNKRHVLHAQFEGTSIRLNVEPNGEIWVVKDPALPTDTIILDGIDFFTSEKAEDVNGNRYSTIVIGSQEWFMENLRTTRYSDGEVIPQIANQTSWNNANSGAWCWLYNDSGYEQPYGKLYNIEAAHSNKLCPVGWKVPSNADWTVLSNYLGGNAVSGGKLREAGFVHWFSPNSGATNESGFSGRGGGERYNEGFKNLRSHGTWWSTTISSPFHYYVSLIYTHTIFSMAADPNDPVQGFSVRCLKE